MTTDDDQGELFHVERPPTEKPRLLEPGDEIAWSDIDPLGNETAATGRIWSLAPAVAGRGRSYWVVTTYSEEPVRVVVTGKRHRVGRQLRPSGRLVEKAGRYVDKGEAYRETDHRAMMNKIKIPTTFLAHDAGRISGTAEGVNAVHMELFTTVLAKIDSGEIAYNDAIKPVDFAPTVIKEYDPDGD